jgi:hypothetical protein
MIELECPWCEEPTRIDLATLTETAAVRCDACRVQVDFSGPDQPRAVALAA